MDGKKVKETLEQIRRIAARDQVMHDAGDCLVEIHGVVEAALAESGAGQADTQICVKVFRRGNEIVFRMSDGSESVFENSPKEPATAKEKEDTVEELSAEQVREALGIITTQRHAWLEVSDLTKRVNALLRKAGGK